MGQLKKLFYRITGQIPEGHDFFSGEYNDGKADFMFIPVGKTRILDGKFCFLQKIGGAGMYRKAEGHYENNKKTGVWTFIRSGSDTLKQIKATFKEGELCGPLEFVCQEVTMAGTRNIYFDLNIIDGKIKGSIQGRFGINVFDGYCDENGYADDKWSMISEENDDVINTKKEVWIHGKFVSAYEQETGRRKIPANPSFCGKINYYLSDDVQHLLHIVSYGSHNQVPQILQQDQTL